MIEYYYLIYKNIVARVTYESKEHAGRITRALKHEFYINNKWVEDEKLSLYLSDSYMLYDGKDDDNYKLITEEEANKIIEGQEIDKILKIK